MNAQMRDAMFLREFCDYTSHGPESVATLLCDQLQASHRAKNFDLAGHLIARLHLEMVMAMETATAHMFAYSRWNSVNGVLGTLVRYDSRELNRFLDALLATDQPLAMLKLPKPSAVRHLAKNQAEFDTHYSDAWLARRIHAVCGMLQITSIKASYNRIKHASVYSRHIVFLHSASLIQPEATRAIKILHRGDGGRKFDIVDMAVTGQKGLDLAAKYKNNISAIMASARGLAGFVAIALDNGLMELE